LTAVIPAIRTELTELFVDDIDLAKLLVSDMTAVGIHKQVTELRKWLSFYPRLSISAVAGANPNIIKAVELASNALQTQTNFDSLSSLRLP
jgi:hypothetical protein